MLNRTTQMGRIVQEPELRHTKSEVPVVSFTIAVGRDFKDKETGERQADFFDCTAWRQTAEYISKYASKGRLVVVEGKLQSRSWKDDDGKNHSKVEIVVDNLYFGDSKKEDSGSTSSAAQKYSSKPASKPTYTPDEEDMEDPDSLPF